MTDTEDVIAKNLRDLLDRVQKLESRGLLLEKQIDQAKGAVQPFAFSNPMISGVKNFAVTITSIATAGQYWAQRIIPSLTLTNSLPSWRVSPNLATKPILVLAQPLTPLPMIGDTVGANYLGNAGTSGRSTVDQNAAVPLYQLLSPTDGCQVVMQTSSTPSSDGTYSGELLVWNGQSFVATESIRIMTL